MTTPLQFLAGARALQGEGASLPVHLSGSTLAESTKSESDADEGVVTFDAAVEWLEIVNEDESNTLTAVVNGITVVVPPGYALEPTRFGGTPSAVVTVTGSTKFTMNRYT